MTDRLIAMLRHHEGARRHPYRCTAGKLTIGVGRNLDDVGLYDDEIDYLLANDINRAKKAASAYGWFADLNEARQAVVISMVFNLGSKGFSTFARMRQALQAGDYATAAAEMLDSKWADDVGPGRSERLAGMMIAGEWQC